MKRKSIFIAIVFGMSLLWSGCDLLTNIMSGGNQQGGTQQENESEENENETTDDDTGGNENQDNDLDAVVAAINACFEDSDGFSVSGIEAVKSDGSVTVEISDDARIDIGGFSNGNGQVDVKQYFEAKNGFMNSLESVAEEYPDVLTDEIFTQIEECLHYDYENNIAATTFYIRMSDVIQIGKVYFPKYTKLELDSHAEEQWGITDYPIGTGKSPAFGDGNSAWEQIILGIKMLFLFEEGYYDSEKFGCDNCIYFAIVSDVEVKNLLIDFEGTMNYTYDSGSLESILKQISNNNSWLNSYRPHDFNNEYYVLLEGGILAESIDTEISLANVENSSLEGALSLTKLPYKSLVDVFSTSTELPVLHLSYVNYDEISLGDVWCDNLYGTNIDKLISNYCRVKGELPTYRLRYWKDMYELVYEDEYQNTMITGWFDAKEVLNGEYLIAGFEDTTLGYNPAAYEIDVSFVALLGSIHNIGSVRNVVVTGNEIPELTNPQDNSISRVDFINSVIDVDMSGIDGLDVKGLVRFEKKSPKTFFEYGLTKIILKEYNEDTIYTGGRYDISKLGDMQDTITGDKIKNKAAYFYLSSDKDYLFGNVGLAKAANGEDVSIGQAYIISEGTHKGKYKSTASNSTEYSNKDIEKAGNGEEYSSGIKLDMGTGTLSSYPLSRANNIKLTPMQRLLLDNQNTIG